MRSRQASWSGGSQNRNGTRRRRAYSEGDSPNDRSEFHQRQGAYGGARPKTGAYRRRSPSRSSLGSSRSSLSSLSSFSQDSPELSQRQIDRINEIVSRNPPRPPPEQPYTNPYVMKKKRKFIPPSNYYALPHMKDWRDDEPTPQEGWAYTKRMAQKTWDGPTPPRSVLRGVPTYTPRQNPDPADLRTIPHKDLEDSKPREKMEKARRKVQRKEYEASMQKSHEAFASQHRNHPVSTEISGQRVTDDKVESYTIHMMRIMSQYVKSKLIKHHDVLRANNADYVQRMARDYLRLPERHELNRFFQNHSKHFWLCTRMNEVIQGHLERQTFKLPPSEASWYARKNLQQRVREMARRFNNLIRPLHSNPHGDHEDVYNELRRLYPDVLQYAEDRTREIGEGWRLEGLRLEDEEEKKQQMMRRMKEEDDDEEEAGASGGGSRVSSSRRQAVEEKFDKKEMERRAKALFMSEMCDAPPVSSLPQYRDQGQLEEDKRRELQEKWRRKERERKERAREERERKEREEEEREREEDECCAREEKERQERIASGMEFIGSFQQRRLQWEMENPGEEDLEDAGLWPDEEEEDSSDSRESRKRKKKKKKKKCSIM